MKPKLFLRSLALVACMLCSISAVAAEAYACYMSSNTTLTFYYDTQRSSRTGTTYDLNAGNSDPEWFSDGTAWDITQVVFDPSFANARPTSAAYWFGYMENLQSIIGLAYFNTSSVTTMQSMFYGCTSLTTLDLSSFNTSNVTSMANMFSQCTGLTSLDVSDFNTSKVTSMRCMFSRCSSLTSLDLSSFNTAQVTDMSIMFEECSSLTSLDLSSFNTANVTTLGRLFSQCSNLRSVDISSFDTRNVTWMYGMFSGCSSLTSLDVSNFNTVNVTNMQSLFSGCSSLTSLDVSNFNTSKVTAMDAMFNNCSSLTSIDVSCFVTDLVTDMSSMFHNCSSLTSLDLSSFTTDSVNNMSLMFSGCSGLTRLDLRSFLTAILANTNYMFMDCSNLITILVSSDKWTTQSINYSFHSQDMFLGCTSIKGEKGTTYDANHVGKEYAHIDGGPDNPGYLSENESYAVYTPASTTLSFYCDKQRSSRSGTTYDLNTGNSDPEWFNDGTAWDITQVVFDPSFANARPTTTHGWFYIMQSLVSITGMESYLNTSCVTDMSNMFTLCENLPSIDLSAFNTAAVTSMNMMFNGCISLTSLDLGCFNTANVTNMFSMFHSCYNLTTIKVGSGWNTDAVTSSSSMFYSCTNLVGGAGTAYEVNHVDKTRAHIDGGTAYPGYLTSCYDYDFECDGLYYNITGENTAEVTYKDTDYNSYSGAITVPETTTLAGVTYNVTAIGDHAFYNCSGLTSISLPTSVKTVGEYAFYNCPGLTSINLTNAETIAAYAFAGCTGITSAVVNRQLESIDGTSFLECSSLTKFMMPSGTGVAGSYYIDNGVLIKRLPQTLVIYPGGKTNTSYTIPDGTVTVGPYAFAGSKVKTVEMPSTLTSIESRAFANCDRIQTIEIIKGVTSIGDYAFAGCDALTQVILPSTLTTLGAGAFHGDEALSVVGTKDKTPASCETIIVDPRTGETLTSFDTDHFSTVTLLVPTGCRAIYKAASVWKLFSTVYENSSMDEEEDVLLGDVDGDGQVNISDVTTLIDHLLGAASNINTDNADVNGDDSIDITDVTVLIDYLLNGSWD